MLVELVRSEFQGQTLGFLTATNGGGRVVFQCLTLELPWLANQRSVSCIPPGSYIVAPRDGVAVGSRVAPYQHFHVLDVPGRDWILFHAGNTVKDSRGCILVGGSIAHRPGGLWLSNSRETLRAMVGAVGAGRFQLRIT